MAAPHRVVQLDDSQLKGRRGNRERARDEPWDVSEDAPIRVIRPRNSPPLLRRAWRRLRACSWRERIAGCAVVGMVCLMGVPAPASRAFRVVHPPLPVLGRAEGVDRWNEIATHHAGEIPAAILLGSGGRSRELDQALFEQAMTRADFDRYAALVRDVATQRNDDAALRDTMTRAADKGGLPPGFETASLLRATTPRQQADPTVDEAAVATAISLVLRLPPVDAQRGDKP